MPGKFFAWSFGRVQSVFILDLNFTYLFYETIFLGNLNKIAYWNCIFATLCLMIWTAVDWLKVNRECWCSLFCSASNTNICHLNSVQSPGHQSLVLSMSPPLNINLSVCSDDKVYKILFPHTCDKTRQVSIFNTSITQHNTYLHIHNNILLAQSL